jgi:hypothetical protein
MWLKRLLHRVRTVAPPAAPGKRQQKILDILLNRSVYDTEAEFLATVLSALRRDSPLEEETLRVLMTHLRGHYGQEYSKIGDAMDEHLAFWQTVADEFGTPLARACYADTLLLARREDEAMELFLATFADQPTLLYEFGGDLYDVARSIGEPTWLRYRLACLQAALSDYQDSTDDDYIREIYSELLEEYAGDAAAMTQIRPLGAIIDAAVEQGTLPRALVRRGVSRHD